MPAGRSPAGLRPVEDHARVRRGRRDLQTATDRAAATAGNRPTLDRVNTTDPRSRIMPGKHDGLWRACSGSCVPGRIRRC
jgi:hypothetical protein